MKRKMKRDQIAAPSNHSKLVMVDKNYGRNMVTGQLDTTPAPSGRKEALFMADVVSQIIAPCAINDNWED